MAKDRYPTPDMPEEITFTTRCVPIPDIPEFIALIGGLLFQATREHFWYEFGTMTIEQATTAMQDALGLYNAIEECGMTCEQIIDCIEDDTDVQQALTNYLASQGYAPVGGGGTPNDASVYNDNPLLIDGSTIEDCDNDNLFGAITQLIDFVHSSWFSFFETLEAQSNGFERAAIIGEGVPISDSIGVDTVANTFDQVLEEIGENYNANFTETLRDTYRCDVFCLVVDTCELDFQTIADYFMARVGASITEDAFADTISWFVAGTFAGTQIVDAAFALAMQALAYGSQVINLDINGIRRGMIAALNDPDADWMTLCEDCNPESSPVIAVSNACGMFGSTSFGTLSNVSGIRWQLTATLHVPSSTYYVTLQRADGGAFHISNGALISGTAPNFFAWHIAGESGCGSGFTSPSTDGNNFTFYSWSIAAAFVIEVDFEDV